MARMLVLAEETAGGAVWIQIVAAALLLVAVVLLAGLVVNVNKMLSRLSAIRRQLEEAAEHGVQSQVQEAVVQLQSIAVSTDRVAMRCDAIEQRLDAVGKGAPGTVDQGLTAAVGALRDGIEELRAPVREIRDQLVRTDLEKLSDEVKRTLYSMGYDQVVIRTDLASLAGGDGKAHVEVSRGGVKSKGYLVVRAGTVVETKISPTYEMFP
jgi:hypothetical protein